MSKYTEALNEITKHQVELEYTMQGTDKWRNAMWTCKEALEIADRLEHAYHNAFGIDLAKCTKYGNESAEQQRDSYSTVMMYEVANVFDDILGE